MLDKEECMEKEIFNVSFLNPQLQTIYPKCQIERSRDSFEILVLLMFS